MRRRRWFARQRGFSLVEVMVGVTMLTIALLGLAAAAAVGLKQNGRAREDTQYFGDVQYKVDSLIGRGFGAITAKTDTLADGRIIQWAPGSAAAAPETVKVYVTRHGYQNRFATVKDTIILFLSKTTPGP